MDILHIKIDNIDDMVIFANNYIKNSELSINDKILDDFVTNITKDRDISHGRDHMFKISRLSIFIAIKEGIEEYFYNDILFVAWLHDVADHKYDKNNNLETILINFLSKYNYFGKYYYDIIQRISYSKEIKNGSSDWLNTIGKPGIIVRNIVSDADKIDAIGKIGIDRCIEYTKEINPNLTKEQVIKNVLVHADEKLLLLKDKFIRTRTGIEIAEFQHNIMVDILKNLDIYIKC